MRNQDLRQFRRRQKRRSYLRLIFLGAAVFASAVVLGAYIGFGAKEEPRAGTSVTASSEKLAAEQAAAQSVPNREDIIIVNNDSPAAKNSAPASAPAQSAPAGTSILIKKSEFRLYLLEDGAVVQSWPVALGRNAGQKRVSGDMKTPDGSFPVDEVIDSSYWTHDFGDGKGEIEGAYGPYFISLDTSELSGGAWDGIGIHGTHDPASIGTRVSEGCIRMNNSDLLALKKHISVGTQVTIEE